MSREASNRRLALGQPDSSTSHLMAEFQLAVNTSLFSVPVPPTPGLYDPSPAFWSASVFTGGLALDPPISSGIFQLIPMGRPPSIRSSAPMGGPVLQPQDVVPEPSSVAIFLGLGAIGLVGYRGSATVASVRRAESGECVSEGDRSPFSC